MVKTYVSLVVAIVFIVAVSVCYAQQNQQNENKPEDWKTYTSSWVTYEKPDGGKIEIKFTIQYPPDWFVVMDQSHGVVLANFSRTYSNYEGGFRANRQVGDMWVYVGEHTDTATHGVWVERKDEKGLSFLWLTGCLNPLSVDVFIMKDDPDLETRKALLIKIGETTTAEAREIK